MSLKDVLSHTTGYDFSGNTWIEQGISRPEILEKLKQIQPHAEPGAFHRYSNVLFSLSEEILKLKKYDLEQALQRLRETLQTEGIQTAAGCQNREIAFPHIENKNPKGSAAYKTLPFPPYYPKATASAAGLFMSLNAMIAFLKLTLGYRSDAVTPETLKTFYTPVHVDENIRKWPFMKWPLPKNQIESFYGLGWRILKAKTSPGNDLIFHSGYIAGIAAFVGFVPKADAGFVILLNQESQFAREKGLAFWKLFLS